MVVTRVADIIQPDVFNKYVTEAMAVRSAMIRSGIISMSPELDALATAGGRLINMPFFQALTGADEIDSDTVPSVPGKIESGQDVAALFMRRKSWGVNDLAASLSGADPLQAIVNQVADYWDQRRQELLFAILKGVFLSNAANNAGDMILDLSIADGLNAAAGNKLSGEGFVEAAQLMGDASGGLVAIGMHSRVKSNLIKQDMIETIRPSDGSMEYEVFQGKRVVVDDGCPVENGGVSGHVYTTYMFGAGAIGLGQGKAKTPTETDRDSLAGDDILVNRQHFVFHPRGVKFLDANVAGKSPTNVEAALAANWLRAWNKKNVRIIAIKSNG